MDSATALSRMAALCSISEHCESDIRQKLQKAAICAEESEEIISKLYEDQYLDNERYCRAFARDKLRFSHWGRVKIAQMLRLKELPLRDIDLALSELPEQEYFNILTETITQKAPTIKDADEYTRRGKLIRFALGRGFAMNEILDALENLRED